MNKLQLNLDELAVESFATDTKATAPRGTVVGHYGTTHSQAGETCDRCCLMSCNGAHTCLC